MRMLAGHAGHWPLKAVSRMRAGAIGICAGIVERWLALMTSDVVCVVCFIAWRVG